MVIVEARPFSESVTRPGSDCVCFQLTTGEKPFPKSSDNHIPVLISEGRRPSKPRRLGTSGMTPAVWKIAEKCWREKAKERPEVNAVLQDLENIVNTGGCTYTTRVCLPYGLTDLQPESESNGNLHRL